MTSNRRSEPDLRPRPSAYPWCAQCRRIVRTHPWKRDNTAVIFSDSKRHYGELDQGYSVCGRWAGSWWWPA